MKFTIKKEVNKMGWNEFQLAAKIAMESEGAEEQETAHFLCRVDHEYGTDTSRTKKEHVRLAYLLYHNSPIVPA